MINKIFIKFLSIIIELIDYPNKKKIIFFLKNELKKKLYNQGFLEGTIYKIIRE